VRVPDELLGAGKLSFKRSFAFGSQLALLAPTVFLWPGSIEKGLETAIPRRERQENIPGLK